MIVNVTKRLPAHLVLRNRLLRQTRDEKDPYRRMARAVLAGDKIMASKPEQGPEIERALFHVAVMLAKEM